MSDEEFVKGFVGKPSRNKRKHVTLTIEEKLEIINLAEEGKLSRQKIATKFGIGKSTVHDIYKTKDKIRMFAAMNDSPDISKRRRVAPKFNAFLHENMKETIEGKFKEEEEEEEVISMEEFPYQDYEVVYDPALPSFNATIFEKPKDKSKEFCNEKLDAKKKITTLTIREKLEVIQQVEAGTLISKVCEIYNIGRTTVYDIIKRKQQIIEYLEKSNDSHRRTFKKSKYPEVEEMMLKWCENQESFTKQSFYDQAKLEFDNARAKGNTLSPSGFCGSWSWAKRFFCRHPQYKWKLLSASGEPIDPLELEIHSEENVKENLQKSEIKEEDESSQIDNQKSKGNKFLTSSEKLEVLNQIDSGKPVPNIAEEFGVSRTTIYDIFKRRVELRERKLTKSNAQQKIVKLPKYPKLEQELLDWCLQQNSYPLSNVLIADKALCLFDTLELSGNFKPSSTWAKKFVLRHPELHKKQGIVIDEDDSESEYKISEIEENANEDYFLKEEIEDEHHLDSFEDVEHEMHADFQEEDIGEEEYIYEQLDELEDNHEDHEVQREIPVELFETSPRKDLNDLKPEVRKQQLFQIPDEIAMKSLKILIKYSEQQGHTYMLSCLTDFERQLKGDVT
ncbi:CLUMA_CG012055, isoform A [Clunio marinus]|uniref:CLUMA_CG012055, isoform A n=1 Tax=Clunio marinus TaxID=568069 RepID=A0A1J1IIC2_9DIPT|nr:CLUMA_CG012055, isoform A [Clunio marinus]